MHNCKPQDQAAGQQGQDKEKCNGKPQRTLAY